MSGLYYILYVYLYNTLINITRKVENYFLIVVYKYYSEFGLTLSDLKHGLTYSTTIDVIKEDIYATNGMLAMVPDSLIADSLMKSGI